VKKNQEQKTKNWIEALDYESLSKISDRMFLSVFSVPIS
jgi:hypothetical protein